MFVFDRLAGSNVDDPYPLYARARAEAGVFFADAFGVWVVTRHDDVRTVLTDVERFSSAFLIRTPLVAGPDVHDILRQGYPEVRVLLNEDPPDHTRTRNLVAEAFSPRRVRELEPRIQRLTDDLVDGFAGDGHADLVRGFALPLPLRVICDILGVPPDDAGRVRDWIEDLKALTSFSVTPEQQRDAARGSVELERYLADLVERTRRQGGDTVLAAIVADGTLSTTQVISLLITLIFGGHETTANLLATALLLMLQRPELLRAARDRPEVIDGLIEETLRADPPVQGTFRRAVTDVELSGVTVPAGAQVFALLASANRDQDVTPGPDTFDPYRDRPDRHLSFGRGIHFCVGAQLARLEARTAIGTLLRRLPDVALAPGFRAPYLPNLMHRGPARLEVVWPAGGPGAHNVLS